MRKASLSLCFAAVLSIVWSAGAQARTGPTPGCDFLAARQCVGLALDAMGGRERLEQVKAIRFDNIGHTLLMEQSYRQAPFITSYERDTVTEDLVGGRILTDAKLTWPEADAKQFEAETKLAAGPDGGVVHTAKADVPAPLSYIDAARQELALGPARLLITAADAPDLHYDAPQTLRSTRHAVVAFKWGKVPVRVLLNEQNHLPDAVETTQEFHDFWYFWGDVEQRILFDNFKFAHGIVFPTNWVEERNGEVWTSTQALDVEFNPAVDARDFAMDSGAAHQSTLSPGWNRSFTGKNDTALVPGIDLYEGSWNSTIVKEPEGIVILEAPISGLYTRGVIEEAGKRYPGAKVEAVLSTSDSWPHTGGVRDAVAEGLPVYILDLNRPLLDRMMAAPHSINPDTLAGAKTRRAAWKIVAGKVGIGSGPNRMELYPLRGASTERQYMVFFPAQGLLYASDTLALYPDGSLYDPELMREVVQAVEREKLAVKTVYAMHQGPVPWDQVLAQIEKVRRS